MKMDICRYIIFSFILITLISCDEEDSNKDDTGSALFSEAVEVGIIENKEINEASGLVAGILNEGTLWVHNDSGNKARIFCLSETGSHLGEFFLENKTNRDWEAIATGPGPDDGVNYLYIGDIGGNWDSGEVVKVFRFPEPKVEKGKTPVSGTIKESEIDVLSLKYPNGKNDAECLLLDPRTKDLFIITKGHKSEYIFKAAYPQRAGVEISLTEVGRLNIEGITAGDISADGSEVLLKTYSHVYYWKREEGQSIEALLATLPVTLPYKREPQGECIAWKHDGSGYFTTSEKLFFTMPPLKFYSRN